VYRAFPEVGKPEEGQRDPSRAGSSCNRIDGAWVLPAATAGDLNGPRECYRPGAL